MKYSIVIPTYNEEKRIEKTLKTIHAFFQKKKSLFEVIVSDDNSSDLTVKVVKDIQSSFPEIKIIESKINYYKGWPVKLGVLASKGDYILMTDADLSTPIEEADKLQKEIDKGAGVAIGSRIDERGHDERESQPLYRRILGKIFTSLRKILTPEIKDSQCGFKMFSRKSAQDLFRRQKIKNIIFDVEILYLAKKLDYKIAQVPVRWYYSGETRMRLNFKNAISTMISLVAIFLWHKNEKPT